MTEKNLEKVIMLIEAIIGNGTAPPVEQSTLQWDFVKNFVL